ncbi:MAG: ABC transporter ATP-binding protein [Anaerobutyricum sp.]
MSECVIEVNNITKSFKVYLDRSNSIKDFIIHSSRRKYENRRVLRGISFKVRKGEAIGLIGRNGCGKSTTLKMLTRIMYPDTGSIRIKGRVSSLIELGAGFHPDMSGRENIYINASIFGLTKKEIDKRVEDIIEFSELEGYIDNPVRTYSSGMYMRLAFSVAINVDADVLLIDEILAVGDANFQAKCFQKLREIKKNGTTIVIVSHALNQIESICERSIWIEEGIIKMEGQPRKVHREYLKYMGLERTERELEKKNKHGKSEDEEQVETVSGKIEKESASTQREGNHKVLFKKVCLLNSEGQETTQFETGET